MLDLEIADISAKEPRLWYNQSQQSPQIKMYLFNRRNSSDFTPKSARFDGMQCNPPAEWIIGDRWDQDDWWLENGAVAGNLVMKNYLKDGHKIAKDIGKMVKDGRISVREGADYLYNLLCYLYIGNLARLNAHDFALQYNSLLKAHKFPIEAGLSSVPDQEPLYDVINLNNTIFFTSLQGDSSRYYFPPKNGIYSPSDMIPGANGRVAMMWRKPKERKKVPDGDNYFRLPATTLAKNRNITYVDAVIDGSVIDINRKEIHTGAAKRHAFPILSEEDVNEGYRKYLSRYGHTVSVKENKKRAAERMERYADGRKEQKEDFKNEIREYHGEYPSEFVDGKVTSLGINPDSTALVYELSYKMDNLVKRAGNNVILSLGKLFCDQLELLPSDRERDVDAYFGTPREYVTRISVDIPSGYTVNESSLSGLNRLILNESGAFSANTTLVSPDKLQVDIIKRYNKGVLPVSEWPEMLSVLDMASEWNNVSILLEKK